MVKLGGLGEMGKEKSEKNEEKQRKNAKNREKLRKIGMFLRKNEKKGEKERRILTAEGAGIKFGGNFELKGQVLLRLLVSYKFG